MKDDLLSRKKMINYFRGVDPYRFLNVDGVKDFIKCFPSEELELCEDAISKKTVIDYVDHQILLCDKALAFSDTSEIDRYAMESIKSTLKVLKDFLEDLPIAIKDEFESVKSS